MNNNQIAEVAVTSINLVVGLFIIGITTALYFSRKSYNAIVVFCCCFCRHTSSQQQKKKLRAIWMLHLLIHVMLLYSVLAVLSSVVTMVKNTTARRDLVDKLFFAELAMSSISGSFISSIKALLIMLWFNVAMVWNQVEDARAVEKKRGLITICMSLLAVLSLVIGLIAMLACVLPIATDGKVGGLIPLVIAAGILYLIGFTQLVITVVLGVMIVRLVKGGLEERKKVTIVKISVVLAGLFGCWLFRFAATVAAFNVNLATNYNYTWIFEIPLRSLPDFFIIGGLVVIFWPTKLPTCCQRSERVNMYLQPLHLSDSPRTSIEVSSSDEKSTDSSQVSTSPQLSSGAEAGTPLSEVVASVN